MIHIIKKHCTLSTNDTLSKKKLSVSVLLRGLFVILVQGMIMGGGRDSYGGGTIERMVMVPVQGMVMWWCRW